MKKELLATLPHHKDYLQTLQGETLYIVDWKDENNGGISFTDYDMGRNAVILSNPEHLAVCCDKFPENALPVKKGNFSKQCECVVFPDNEGDNNWELFVEMKYAKDIFKARDPRNKYSEKMLLQIEKTVSYFRSHGILPKDKVVYAIASFPFLENFNAWFDQNLLFDALVNHHIILRATNSAKVISKKVLAL